ncbi:NAD(P)-dependent oxidoreductase, partial [Thioclava sp. BHET1]
LLALCPGGLVCLMATCPPDEVRRLAAEVTAAGRRFLDCPVSGGVAGAKAASLTLMGAGAKAIWEEAAPVLRCLGTRLYYCGAEAGQGAAVKAINQLLCGVHLAAAAEAIALGEKAGVDTGVLLDLGTGSSAGT